MKYNIAPQMPDELKGNYSKFHGNNKSISRGWTPKEIDWVVNLRQQGYSMKQIAESVGRTQSSVSIKLKRISKNANTYNENHLANKYLLNYEFIKDIKPNSILDLYCGANSFYKKYNAITNDINKSINADYHEDAFKLLCKLYYENNSFDLIDLDPYGSAYDCFDLAIKMANKGIAITLGELGHKRFKRLDFVKYRYDIESMDDFNINNIIKYIQKIGLRNKKTLIVWNYKEWKNIGRVYFKIENHKIDYKNIACQNEQLSIFDIEEGNDDL